MTMGCVRVSDVPGRGVRQMVPQRRKSRFRKGSEKYVGA